MFFAIYFRALPYPLVFDDYAHILENRAIRYLWHPRVFLESEHSRGRPLPYVTFALSYALQGLSLSWLRVWSLFLHFGSACLVGALYRRWFAKNGSGALLSAAIFLLHPLAVDSVVYLSARGSLLVLFFLLLAFWLRGLRLPAALASGGFLAAAALAFLSRETAVAALPLLLLFHRFERRSLRELWPCLLPILAGGLVLLWLKWGYLGGAFRGYFTIQGDVDIHSPFEYLRLALGLWPRLLELFVNPGALAIDHAVSLPPSWVSPAVLFGAALWLAFAGCLAKVAFSRKAPAPPWVLAPCWIFLCLLPTHSIFPMLDPFAERHVYLALPGFAWGLAWTLEKISARLKKPRLTEALAGLALVLGALLFTLPRVETWNSASSLWLDAHAKAPGKFRVAYNAALSLLDERDDAAGALRLLGETFGRLRPGALAFEQQENGVALGARAFLAVNGATGISDEAVLKEFPQSYWRDLIQLEAWLGQSGPAWYAAENKARKRWEKEPLSERARDPNWVANTFRLLDARHLERRERREEAIMAYEFTIATFQDTHFPYWVARERLADLYLATGREKDAIAQLELAAYQYKVFKRFPYRLQRKLYELYLKNGDLARATDAIGEIVRVYTDSIPLRRLYADLLVARSDKHAARQKQEADYYEKFAVLPNDEREFLRP